MATIDPVIVKIQADVNDLKTGLQKAQESLKGLDDSVKKADSGFSSFITRVKQVGATLGVTFAASQVVSFFKDSVAAAQEAEAAQARLANLLRNTNGATEEQIVALNEQAKALEAVGVVSADNVTVAQSQLATFDLAASSIKTLTPAILDYVTAEKGASATADDFKQMTNGLAQALNGQFGSLTRLGFVMDDATKKTIASGTESERAAALVEVLNSTYKGFNENLRNTSAGAMQVALNDFNNLKQEIGQGLQPVIATFANFLTKTLFPAIRSVLDFIKNNQSEIKAFAVVIGIATVAWAAYTVQQKLATLTFQKFTEALKKNAFVLVVTAIASLVAVLVKAYNNVQWFRDAVNGAAKFALTAFASIIPIVARVYEAIAKIVTGPMRLFLGALSKLPGVGKFAKSGLDIINKGLDGISDLGDKAAAKATELSKKLDGMAKIAKKAGEETKKAVGDPFKGDTRGDKGGGLNEKQKKKLDDYRDKVKDIYKDMNETIAEANEKATEALERRNERMLDAEQRYQDTKADLEERYAERMADAQERYDETVSDLKDRRRKTEEAATKKYAESVLNINAEVRKREIELEKTRDRKIADLMEAANRKREDISKAGQERLAGIIEASSDRLRDAFAKATEFSLEDMFAKGRGRRRNVVDVMRAELASMQSLQRAAGELAGAGYSQTFIEQVVKAGPKAGLRMVAQIKKLSPEQQSALKDTYSQLESLNKTGMDSIAKSLSDNGRLATTELQEMYNKTSADIANSLAQVDADLKANIAEATKDYLEALAEAKATRDEKLAEAKKTLDEALAQAQDAFNESLADADKTLKKAQDEAKKILDKGLADAQKTLQKALLDAQKDYEKAVDEINTSTQKKLDSLMDKLRAVAAAMASISASAASGVVPKAPAYAPSIIPATTSSSSIKAADSATSANLVVNQTFNNVTADAWDIHEKTLSAIRYGQAVTPKPAPRVPASTGGGSTGSGRYGMMVE